jgi:hypothetical protein
VIKQLGKSTVCDLWLNSSFFISMLSSMGAQNCTWILEPEQCVL